MRLFGGKVLAFVGCIALLGLAWQARLHSLKPQNNASPVSQQVEQQRAAVAQIESAAAARPFDAALQRQLVAAYLNAGNLEKAQRVLEHIVSLAPNEAAGWLALGEVQARQNLLNVAAQSFGRAIFLEPKNIQFLCSLAQIEIKRGKTQRAETLIKKAQRLNPRAGFPHFIKGQLLRRTAMAEVAIPEFQRAVELESGNVSGWMALADAQFQVKRLNDAEKSCQKALQIDTNNADILSLLAQVKMQRAATDDFESAMHLAEQALGAQPQHSNSHYVLGVLRLRNGAVEDAITHLEAALAAEPSRLDARINLAKAYQRAGRNAEADQQLKLLETAAEYEKKVGVLVAQTQARPHEASLHFQLGELYASVGGRDKAMLEYQRALDLKPGYSAAIASLKKLEGKTATP